MENKDIPAFPVQVTHRDDGIIVGIQTGNTSGFEMGLTKREYFAAMAMQGLLANKKTDLSGLRGSYDTVAKDAVMFADELLNHIETITKPQP